MDVVGHKLNHSTRKTPKCWLWIGAKNDQGYGQVRVQGRGLMYVHRLAYEREHGVTLTRTQCVLHVCDTPLCVRPDHLRLGDRRSNSADMVLKNRGALGDRNGNKRPRKLTDEESAQWDALLWYGASPRDLALTFRTRLR